MDKAPRMGYQLHPMKPPLWILVIAMISNLVALAQEGSQVLLDDRGKPAVPTEERMFTLAASSQALTPATARSEALATLNPRPATQELRRSAEAGNVAAQARLASLYLRGEIGQPKSFELAYRWALIAQASGESQSRHILRELDLFLTPAQLTEAKRAAEEFLKKQQESRR